LLPDRNPEKMQNLPLLMQSAQSAGSQSERKRALSTQ